MTDTIGEFRPRPAALGLQLRRHARIAREADPLQKSRRRPVTREGRGQFAWRAERNRQNT